MKTKKKKAFNVGEIVKMRGVKSPRMVVTGSHILKQFDGSECEVIDVQWFCLGKSLQSASFNAALLYKPRFRW